MRDDYDLRDEYDLRTLTILPRGTFTLERRIGTNVYVLAPDVSEAFPTDEAVNIDISFLAVVQPKIAQ